MVLHLKIFIKELRTERKMSLTELSKLSGVAVSHIHAIENGYKIPTIMVICKIAKALGVESSELYSCRD